MRVFVLGGQGFIGSALVRHCRENGIDCLSIDIDNYREWLGQACDILINANGNSKKFLAQQAPLKDFELSVQSVRASLEDFRFNSYVYLSSADVYPDSTTPQRSREADFIDITQQTPYGFHKYLAELCVRHRANHHLIFRLSGFVGPNLKKNPIFDILNGRPLWVHPESEFQYLHTKDLSRIIFEIIEKGLDREIINIGGQGVVRLAEVLDWGKQNFIDQPGSPLVRCEISIEKISKYCHIPDSRETIKSFLHI